MQISLTTSVVVQGNGSSWVNGDSSHLSTTTLVDTLLLIPGQSGVYIPIPAELAGWTQLRVTAFLNYVNVTPSDLVGGNPQQLSFYKDQSFSYTPLEVGSNLTTGFVQYSFEGKNLCQSTRDGVLKFDTKGQYWFGLQSSAENKVPNFIKKQTPSVATNSTQVYTDQSPVKFIGVTNSINHNHISNELDVGNMMFCKYNDDNGQTNKQSFFMVGEYFGYPYLLGNPNASAGTCISDGVNVVYHTQTFGHLNFGQVTNTDYCASHTIFVRKYDNGVAVSVPNIASNGYTDTYTVGGMYTQDNLYQSTTANSIHPNAARLSQLSSKDASALQGVGTNRFNLSSLSGYQEASYALGCSGVQNTIDGNVLMDFDNVFDSLFIWNPLELCGGKHIELQVYKVVFQKIQ